MPIIKCDYCGKLFNRDLNELKRNKKNYCCKTCFDYGRKTNRYITEEDITKIIINSPKYGIKIFMIDTCFIEKVKKYSWCLLFVNETFYARAEIKVNGKKEAVMLHRLIMNCPIDMQVDHINHDTQNNTKNNLRIVTKKQNMENRKGAERNCKSGIRGVNWFKRDSLWEVNVGHNGKKIYGGRFKDIVQAEKAAKELRKQYFTHSAECEVVL